MFRENIKLVLTHVIREVGLQRCPGCYRDYRFVAAIFAGMGVLWLVHGHVPVFSANLTFQWMTLISILIWQPFIEELLFRGILQGQLSKFPWGGQVVFKLTAANIVTSVLFVCMHMMNTPLVWALAIFIPSLLLGYCRDIFNSVYPSMVLHSAYNSMVILGLLIHGNLVFDSIY